VLQFPLAIPGVTKYHAIGSEGRALVAQQGWCTLWGCTQGSTHALEPTPQQGPMANHWLVLGLAQTMCGPICPRATQWHTSSTTRGGGIAPMWQAEGQVSAKEEQGRKQDYLLR